MIRENTGIYEIQGKYRDICNSGNMKYRENRGKYEDGFKTIEQNVKCVESLSICENGRITHFASLTSFGNGEKHCDFN